VRPERAHVDVRSTYVRPLPKGLRRQRDGDDVNADSRVQSSSLPAPGSRERPQPSDLACIHRCQSTAFSPANPGAYLDDDSPRARGVRLVSGDDVELAASAVAPVAFQDAQARFLNHQAGRVFPGRTENPTIGSC